MSENYKTRAVFYLRKSRMDPESESIDETLVRHEDTLMQLAAKLELNIVKVFKEVVSGDGLFTRPQMVQLLRDIEQDKYTAIVCMDIDRLGRSSQKDSGIILETLQEHNVFIVTPNKTYNPNDDIDEQSVEMQSFIARQELKSIKRRLRRGTEKTVEQGYHITEPPYGYRRAYIEKHPTLEICEEEAKVIRMVFDMYVNRRMGSYTIAEELNKMGYQPRKNTFFSRSTIRFYLQNPTYVGKIVWNKRKHIKKKSVTDKNKSILNPEDKWIVSEGVHPAIVSQEIFEQAQEIRLTRSHPPSYTGTLQNPFAGLIYCRNCGSAMQRQFSRVSGARLLCPNTGCTRSTQTKYVEQYVLQILRAVLADCSGNIKNDVQSENKIKSGMIKDNIRDIEKEIKALNGQKAKLHDLLEQGVYDVPTFLDRSAILADKLSAAETVLTEKRDELSDIESAPPIKEALPIISQLLSHYDSLTAAEKNELLKKFIKRMTYSRDSTQKQGDFSLSITWRFSF